MNTILNKWQSRLLLLGLFILLSARWQLAHAGSQQNTLSLHSPLAIAQFSKGVEEYAAKNRAHAFIIGRVGRSTDDLPKGIFFTHTAVAIYSAIQLDNGDTAYGYAIHNLYQNASDKARSQIVTDYPIDFFWGAHELKAGVVIPTHEIQMALIEIVRSNAHLSLHNPKYSVVANPFDDKFQNCTEFTLDMINAAIYSTTNIRQLKVNAKAHFEPQRVHTSRFALMLGTAFLDGVTTKDHKGRVFTATFSSIARYMQQYGLSKQAVTLGEDLVPMPL